MIYEGISARSNNEIISASTSKEYAESQLREKMDSYKAIVKRGVSMEYEGVIVSNGTSYHVYSVKNDKSFAHFIATNKATLFEKIRNNWDTFKYPVFIGAGLIPVFIIIKVAKSKKKRRK